MKKNVILVQSQGQWLALSDGEFVAAGESFDEVWEASCASNQ